MMWIGALLTILAIGALSYWLFILTEGVYLGKRVVIALYDWNAASYDRVKQVLPHEDGIHLARPLLSAIESVHSPLVLDIATGTGRLPVALLRQWDFHGRIVGLDLSQRMLTIARHKTWAHCQRVAWIRDDAMNLPFPSGIFHAVTCIEALEFLPKPWEALAEMVRVLRPGGQLMVTNRVGVDALFLPGRAYRPAMLEQRLQALGLANVKTRRWQVHYDLIDAQKPFAESERK
ncbi:MAG: class I SAM-dependent methyltransferase [Anaerolineae bacterium]